MTITSEPAIGSVVLDYMDDAWQRRSDGRWYCAIDADEYSRWEWRTMVDHCCPITLVYDAKETV